MRKNERNKRMRMGVFLQETYFPDTDEQLGNKNRDPTELIREAYSHGWDDCVNRYHVTTDVPPIRFPFWALWLFGALSMVAGVYLAPFVTGLEGFGYAVVAWALLFLTYYIVELRLRLSIERSDD